MGGRSLRVAHQRGLTPLSRWLAPRAQQKLARGPPTLLGPGPSELAGRGGTGAVHGVDTRHQVRVPGPLQGGMCGKGEGNEAGATSGARGDGEVAIGGGRVSVQHAGGRSSDRQAGSERALHTEPLDARHSPLGSLTQAWRPCPSGRAAGAPWRLRHDPEHVPPRAVPGLLPPWLRGSGFSTSLPVLLPACGGLVRDPGAPAFGALSVWRLLAGPLRIWGGSTPLAPRHLSHPQPHRGACATSGLSRGTGGGLASVRVGSLACARGPGAWEAPGKVAKAGLEMRPAGRCGASPRPRPWLRPQQNEPKIQTLPHLGVWFVLSEPRGLPVLRKITL